MVRRCAIFDLDRTLTCRPTWLRFLLFANRGRPGFAPDLAMLGWMALRWQLGRASRDDVKEAGLACLRWADRSELSRLGEAFARRECASGLRPGALRGLEQHRAEGDALVLMTAAPEITALPLARALRFDHVICTPVCWTQEGRLTGRIALPNCYGAVKAARLDTLAEELGGIEIAAAYSDHISDLGLLRRAARGVAVNPSPALRRAALTEGLEIVDWGRPAPVPASPRIPETAS
ncbi:MAG: HAD-IB family hydrolase [Alphaproteobacteria bacterium HGW-Alphaproteobacteria-2]|nr:MAG: HAD-IB family hydrolase [Alphaproteobacteria bacterium HGW-Alphaproteobacteria-2]